MTKSIMQERINDFITNFGVIISAEFIDWLKVNGFFTVPASTKYHGSFEGGLYEHSSLVAKKLLDLTNKNNLIWQNERSPKLIGMFHDLCKIKSYVKVDDKYKWNNQQLLCGHGEKSVILLQRFMQLTEEEIMCIRWHMGAFSDKDNLDYYRRAVKRYPNVLWTHHADMLVSQCMGV